MVFIVSAMAPAHFTPINRLGITISEEVGSDLRIFRLRGLALCSSHGVV